MLALRSALAAVLALPVVLSSGCVAPAIDALVPPSGPEHTLVEIDGQRQFLASAYWDAGSPSEQRLAAGFLGAYLFTVPVGAALGAHAVQLRNGSGGSNTETFDVTAPVAYGAPRVDRVSLVFADFQPGNQVNTWVYVQVANADSNAEILVNGAVAPTVPHRALRNDLRGVNLADLSYPIHHWIAFLVAPGPLGAGSQITIACRNADGSTSSNVSYGLPADAATLDRDGDDLPDAWEQSGYDADGDGTIDVDLPALGANPLRPDVFVEVDVMNGLTNPPGAGVWNALTAMFAAAPILNPFTGTDGVNLVLDTSGSVPFFQTVDLNVTHDPPNSAADFITLKGTSFPNATRGRIYHYCIWGNMRPNGSSGISDVLINAAGTDFAGPGDDFIVSFDDFGASFQTVRSMAETFAHELGHGFQQRHGGATHFARTPPYNSVMSYSWQLRTGQSNATRTSRPVYAPYYYALNAAVETGGAVPAGATSVVPDYSIGMGRNLVESSLSEPAGLYNGNGIDWNGNGTTSGTVSVDLNGDGDTADTWTDFPNWFRLVYSGPRQNGQFGN